MDRSTSANSADLEESGVLVDEDSEKSGTQTGDDRRPSSKPSDAGVAGKQKGEETKKEGLSTTDPEEDGATFAEKVQEED